MISTDEGIRKEVSDEQPRKAEELIWLSLDGHANLNTARARHPWKAPSQIISTETGILKEVSDEQPRKAEDLISLS
jgi:transcriptional regulator of met regulon